MREREGGDEGKGGWEEGEEGWGRGEGMGRGGSGEMVDTDKNSNAGVRYWQLTGDVTLISCRAEPRYSEHAEVVGWIFQDVAMLLR